IISRLRFFFFSSRRRHTRCSRDWSSDVCSSDLTYAADALFDLLNDPTSGFQQRLVTNGPFESVTGTYYTLSHSGPIEIVGKTSPERAQDALVRLLNELETLDVLEGVSDEDLAIAKKHREVQSALTRERIAGLAPALAQWWSSAGLDYHLAYDGRMAAQTIDDLRRFAGTYVVGRPRVIGVLAPPETTDRLAAWLRHPAARSGPGTSPADRAPRASSRWVPRCSPGARGPGPRPPAAWQTP